MIKLGMPARFLMLTISLNGLWIRRRNGTFPQLSGLPRPNLFY